MTWKIGTVRFVLSSAVFLAVVAPALSGQPSIDPALVASTLGVSTRHLRVTGGIEVPDVWYEVNNCSVSPSAARTGFQNDLVRLLPVLLAKYPGVRNIFVHGGCPVVDAYGRGSFDENAINAMFTRENLDKVVWDRVRPDDLFDHVAHGRWMNPEMRP